MIIILEGVNGVGKTTYANILAKNLELTVYCPFRSGDPNIHRGGRSNFKKNLEEFHVPYKTHVDDLYVADFLGSTRTSVILDRSMSSAIAYGQLDRDRWLPDDMAQLLEFWQSLFQKEKVLYVWLFTSSHDVAYERAMKRSDSFWPLDVDSFVFLEEEFSAIYDRISLPKLKIDTGYTLLSRGVEKIERALGVLK